MKDETPVISRPIETTYWFRGKVVQVNRSKHVNKAVERCFGHMQINEYGATTAQVYDMETGELHAEVVRNVRGKVEVTFERDPRNFVTPETLEKMKKRGLI